jgi:hypothetical protein
MPSLRDVGWNVVVFYKHSVPMGRECRDSCQDGSKWIYVPYMDIMFVASLSTRKAPPRRGGMLAVCALIVMESHFCGHLRYHDHNSYLQILIAAFY